MNACLLQPGQDETDRSWSMLLLIDVKRGLASLTPGYALEAFIEDSAWENALHDVAQLFAVGDFRAGLLDFLDSAMGLLALAAKDAGRKVGT